MSANPVSITPARPAALVFTTLTLIATAAVSGAGEAGPAERRVRVPSFSARVDLVNLHVSAVAPGSGTVTDLEQDDFVVFEDGARQEVAVFRRERVPLSVAVLIDCSLSMSPSLPAVKAAALRLVNQLGPEDEAQVVGFNQRFTIPQPFTTDKGLLEQAVEGLRAEGATSVYNAVYLTLQDPKMKVRPDELRRRAIVVFSDGLDTASLVSDEQVLERARKGDVTLYAISMRRAGPLLPDQAAASSLATFFLTRVAKDTGGRAYFPEAPHELDGLYESIGNDLRSQYSLGYVSSNPAQDGSFRQVSVHAARGDVLLRHRTGYYAPRSRGPLAEAARAAAARAASRAVADR